MASRKNVEWLQRTGRRYVMGAARSELRRLARAFTDESGWQQVREGVEAKLHHEPKETFALDRLGLRLPERLRQHTPVAGRM